MNRTAKIILGVVAGVIILCLICGVTGILMFRASGRTVERSFQTGSTNAGTIADGIAEYDLPVGFGDEFGMQFVDFAMVGYTGEDKHSHIFFFQMPAYVKLDEVEIRNRMKESQASGDLPEELKVVEYQTGVVREQEIELVVSEGVNHEGRAYRQVSSVFQGKGGQAMVVFEAPVDAWDQATVDAFLASIR